MYTGIKFTNNASTQLFKSIASDSTELEVNDNYAAVFPKLKNAGDYFMLTLQDMHGNREIVKCTSRTDSVLTVARAQEGTTAKSFPVGALLELRLTADSIAKVSEDASVVKYHASTTAADVGKADAIKYGHIKLSDNFESGDQAITGTACSPYGFQQAVTRLLHASSTELISESTTWVVPEDATYTIVVVGGGGNGGTGGNASEGTIASDMWYGEFVIGSGGGAGGGGAGQVITQTLSLHKGDSIPIIVGGPSGASKFGTYITALGGINGSNGGSSSGCGCNCGNNRDWYFSGPGTGGANGLSYGSPATAGSSGTSAAYSYNTCYGGTGGRGGVSVDGIYGNGGNGGAGQSISNPQAGCSTTYFGSTAGSAGTQGCVKITVKLG